MSQVKETLLKELGRLTKAVENDEFSEDDLEHLLDFVMDKTHPTLGQEWLKYMFTGWWFYEGRKNENQSV